ncbi:MAG TPA: GNAT family N-acetyltransferase [Gammaproteobacteria bacterium]|nr:GNAT family N-acetyltransferase [Gammaproteobacteria bacterium]
MSQEKVEKFLIRRAEPEDFRDLQRIHEQPRAVWGTLQLPYPSAQTWRQRLEQAVGGHYTLVACARDAIVGSLGLSVQERSPRRSHVATIGLAVHDEWQGRGIGTALLKAAIDLADRWLNVRRLELIAFVDNEAALRLYKRFGFEIEGLLRRYAFRDGAFVDAYTLARLR